MENSFAYSFVNLTLVPIYPMFWKLLRYIMHGYYSFSSIWRQTTLYKVKTFIQTTFHINVICLSLCIHSTAKSTSSFQYNTLQRLLSDLNDLNAATMSLLKLDISTHNIMKDARVTANFEINIFIILVIRLNVKC